ncbi:hypothetical protein AND_008226, partial [Anopheles darlingi]
MTTMTSTATIPRGAPQTMVPSSLVLPSTLVVPRRSSVVNAGSARSSAEVVSPLAAANSEGRWSARKSIESPSNHHHTASLKTLSCDLSELLVRNLSLRRSETSERQPCQQQQHQQLVDKLEEQFCGSGGGSGTSNANRNSLCDTFPSVNKFIKLKRVSSDGSNLSRLSVVATTAAGGNCTKIVEQPSTTGARFKRVEISVRQGRTTPSSATSGCVGGEVNKRGASVNQRRTSGAGVQPSSSESDAEEEEEEEEIYSVSGTSAGGASASSVRKSVIVNQLDQVDENCPLLVATANGSNNGATVTLRKKDSSLVFTTRKPVAAGSGTAGEPTAAASLRKEQACNAVPKVVLRRRRPDRSGDREVLVIKRRSLPWPLGTGTLLSKGSITEGVIEEGGEGGEETRQKGQRSSSVQETGREKHLFSKTLRHSWNAPGYDILEEDPGGEDLQKDFASIIHNLAGLRNHHLANGTHESVSLLEQHSPQIVPSRATRPTSLGSGQGRRGGRPSSWMQSSPMVMVPPATIPVPTGGTIGTGAAGTGNLTETSSPHTGSLSAPVPRKRRFEAFLKNLVGRRPSKEPPSPAPPPPPLPPAVLLPSPEIKISKSPSEHNLAELERSRLHVSTTSLSSVHQKLWSVVPLLKRDVSCNSLASPKTTPLLMFDGYQSATATGTKLPVAGGTGKLAGPAGVGGLRKCETVLALTGSVSQTLEPIRPLNRLRNCASVATCSRCSSLLSLAAAGSRYSLNASNGAFVPVASGPSELASSQHQLPQTAAVARGLRKKLTDAVTITSGGSGGSSKRKHVGNLLRLTSSTRRSSSSSSSSSSAASSPCSSSTPSSSSSSSTPSSSASTPNGAGSPAASVSSKTAMFVPSPTAGSQLLIPVPALSGSPVATNAVSTTTTTALTPTVKFTCKLCLGEFSAENLTRIAQCACSFCTE